MLYAAIDIHKHAFQAAVLDPDSLLASKYVSTFHGEGLTASWPAFMKRMRSMTHARERAAACLRCNQSDHDLR